MAGLLRQFALIALVFLGLLAPQTSQATVLPPNGTHSDEVVDLSVQTSAGEVSWKRVFNGSGWRFNRHWDGINASYKPMVTQSTGGGSSLSAGSNASGTSADNLDQMIQPQAVRRNVTEAAVDIIAAPRRAQQYKHTQNLQPGDRCKAFVACTGIERRR